MVNKGSPRVWCIRGGNNERVGGGLFRTEQVVALDEDCMPNLSQLGNSRAAYRAVYAPQNGHLNSQQIGKYVGDLFRFVHEIRQRDLVVYPSSIDDRLVYIGRVVSDYFYVAGVYTHRRKVKWLDDFTRDEFIKGSLNTQSRFCRMRKYAPEMIDKVRGL